MINLINRLTADFLAKTALENHTARKDAVYIIISSGNRNFTMQTAEEFSRNRENIIKDYYSALINMNKPVDKGKKIQSNNKYTIFCKKLEELTEERLGNYYNALECEPEESEKYIGFILKNKESFISLSKNKIVKIFFPASVDEYKTEGEKYFYENVFANNKNISLNAAGEEIGAPLTLNTNEGKPYNIQNPTKIKYSAMYTRDVCYKIKLLLDCLKGFYAKGFDKAYFFKNSIIPVYKNQIFSASIDVSNSIFVEFGIEDKGKIVIKDIENIPVFKRNLFNKDIYYYYKKIDELFFNGDLYSYISNNAKNTTRNSREKHYISDILRKWFFKGSQPDYYEISLLEKQFIQIVKNELGENYDMDIEKIVFLKELSKEQRCKR